tara:strand:+ start:4581 stop:4847 length:267 start_codon:yes stop_codon:yes gene_type:complete
MAYLVSPCCGAEYSDDEIPVSNCCGVKQNGDSDLCPDPDCLEHTDFYEYLCSNCDEWFENPIEDYEYESRMRESHAEMMADERRDLGI